MKEFIRDVIIAFIIVGLLSFVIKPTIVKESSMEDTLHENNYLILFKLAYVTKDHPDYGDIVVFKTDLDKDDGSGKKLLIKRVIGVEGDYISIVEGQVYINGDPLDEPYVKGGYTDGDVVNYQVPKDRVYLMGDNRAVSLDSRSELLGTVSEDEILGKAVMRLYPFDQIGILH